MAILPCKLIVIAMGVHCLPVRQESLNSKYCNSLIFNNIIDFICGNIITYAYVKSKALQGEIYDTNQGRPYSTGLQAA